MVHSRESTIDGTGLFASQAIPAGTRIMQYLGERIDKTEATRRCEAGNHFIFTLDDVWDGIEVRGLLEGGAARLAAERLVNDSEVEPLRKRQEEMDALGEPTVEIA